MKKSLLILLLAFGTLVAQGQTIHYVDINATSGLHDGTSWANAFLNPQNAFDNASTGDEVWIAQGTYSYPQGKIIKRAIDRSKYFLWKVDSLSVFGGFDGTETSKEQRDWKKNETILTGEIQNDNDSSNNAYHVLMGPDGDLGANLNYSLIDGLIIEKGCANGDFSTREREGGGFIYEEHVKRLDMINMVFRNNFGGTGGAISFSPARITGLDFNLINCEFYENSSPNGSIISANSRRGSGTISVVNSLMHNNYNVDMQNVGFSNSFHISFVATSASVSMELINCTIANNKNISAKANKGKEATIGGRVNQFNSTLKVQNCIIYGNTGDSTTFYLEKILNNPDPIFFFNNNIVTDDSYMDIPTATSLKTYKLDPGFNNASSGDFSLNIQSNAVDKGDSSFLTEKNIDFSGLPRISGSEVDLGCYEYQNTVGLKSIGLKELLVFPNPTNGILHVAHSKKEIISMEVIDLTGKVFLIQDGMETRIDVGSIENGVYLLKVNFGTEIGYSRFIKK